MCGLWLRVGSRVCCMLIEESYPARCGEHDPSKGSCTTVRPAPFSAPHREAPLRHQPTPTEHARTHSERELQAERNRSRSAPANGRMC